MKLIEIHMEPKEAIPEPTSECGRSPSRKARVLAALRTLGTYLKNTVLMGRNSYERKLSLRMIFGVSSMEFGPLGKIFGLVSLNKTNREFRAYYKRCAELRKRGITDPPPSPDQLFKD